MTQSEHQKRPSCQRADSPTAMPVRKVVVSVGFSLTHLPTNDEFRTRRGGPTVPGRRLAGTAPWVRTRLAAPSAPLAVGLRPAASVARLAGVVPAPLLPHLRRARDLADRHYAEPLDLGALAEAAHGSKYHFARCFAETYGETPIRHLTRRRIERAQDLLRSANLTVTEVCVLVGFASLGSRRSPPAG